MPELSDALHELYEEEARSFSTPPRGLNALAAQARGARRRTLMQASGMGALGVVGVGALLLGPLNILGDEDKQPVEPGTAPSEAPFEPSYLAWDPWGALDHALATFTVPQCGDEFAPEPVAVAGILPAPAAIIEGDASGDLVGIWVADGFVVSDDAPTEFLALQASYVITQDGVVVGTANFLPENLDLFRSASAPSSGATFRVQNHCATMVAWHEEFGDSFNNYDNLDSAAQAQLDERMAQFGADHGALLAGEYLVYQVTPIIFGEHLAVAKQLKGIGVSSLGQVISEPGSTRLANDLAIAPYCTPGEEDGFGGTPDPVCSPPLDVLKDVLRFTIDRDDVVRLPSGVAISEPVVVTFPEASA